MRSGAHGDRLGSAMRILIAHSFYRLAGGEDGYVNQQLELLGRRHEVELLGRRNEDLAGGLATARRMTYSRRQLAAVEAAIRSFEPDVIHLHNAYPSFGPAVHLAARNLEVPLVMTVHNFRLRCPNGYMFTEGRPCRRCEAGNYLNPLVHRCFPSKGQTAGYSASLWTHRFVLGLDDRVTLYIPPSRFVGRRLVEWGIPVERVEVVRNFTELHPVVSGPGEFGLYVGRISSEKGLDVLLKALALAGDPPFVVLGDGPLLEDLRRLGGDLGLERTEFRGRVTGEEVVDTLGRASFVALPSLWDENAPLAALEAMAAGRPLLVTETGGLPELVEDGEGFSCSPGDAAGMAERIVALTSDPESCMAAGRRARKRAENEFAPAVHLEHLERSYAKALALGPV